MPEFLVLCLLLGCWLWRRWHQQCKANGQFACPRRACAATPTLVPATHARRRVKPAWIKTEVIRLAALCPRHGCRKLAATFNRLHAHRAVSVGKTYVADVLRCQALTIVRLRQDIKHRIPRTLPKNTVWALDLTFSPASENALTANKPLPVLGIIDHGSRRCLRLKVLLCKSSLHLLAELLHAFADYGMPRSIRTDNEAIFTSRLFRSVLRILGIRHKTIDKHSPWQNGKIERLFGTLKPLLKQISCDSISILNHRLFEFGLWYNHLRPHQHLGNLTPVEHWQGMAWTDFEQRSPQQVHYFNAWGGLLTGFYIRR